MLVLGRQDCRDSDLMARWMSSGHGMAAMIVICMPRLRLFSSDSFEGIRERSASVLLEISMVTAMSIAV